jgi:outer membrane lipoprotein LolB
MNNFTKIVVKILSLSLLNVLLIGCATAPITKNLTWKQQQQSINSLNTWHAIGKIGFTNGKQGGTATLDWQQNGEHFNLMLQGPFKIDTMYITGHPGNVHLATSEGVKQTATAPEAIIQKQLGWTIPVSGLVHWARGVPIQGVPIEFIQLSKENRVIKLKQQGWTIDYYDYKQFEQFILPTKITLQYGKIKIKLIFRNWI